MLGIVATGLGAYGIFIGEGTFDTAFADVEGRRLYIPRKNPGRITVFNMDTLELVGEIPDAAANGVVIDPKSGHGFASSKPVTMFENCGSHL